MLALTGDQATGEASQRLTALVWIRTLSLPFQHIAKALDAIYDPTMSWRRRAESEKAGVGQANVRGRVARIWNTG